MPELNLFGSLANRALGNHFAPSSWCEQVGPHAVQNSITQSGMMKIIKTKIDSSVLEIGREELLTLNAALNEICHGIAVFEFETRIGADRRRAARLPSELGEALGRMDSPGGLVLE